MPVGHRRSHKNVRPLGDAIAANLILIEGRTGNTRLCLLAFVLYPLFYLLTTVELGEILESFGQNWILPGRELGRSWLDFLIGRNTDAVNYFASGSIHEGCR